MALTSSYPGTIGDPDEIAGVILSLIATTVLASSGDIGPDGAFATVVVVIVISTLVSGGFFWALGHFRCGDLIRYVPFPVIGGVIVVMGWLLVEGGVVVITGLEEMPADLMALLAPD